MAVKLDLSTLQVSFLCIHLYEKLLLCKVVMYFLVYQNMSGRAFQAS